MASKKLTTLEDLYNKYKERSTFGDDTPDKFVPTGSVIFDQVLSRGQGLPAGSWIQISADSGVGKTHLVLQTAKGICATGGRVVYLDSEKGVNTDQLNKLGLKQYLGSAFFLYPISTFEEAEECMDIAVMDELVSLIIIDSITGLVPQKVLEKSVGEVEPGLKARFTGAFIEKYKAKLSYAKSKISVISLNQKRVKFEGWQASVKDAGGNAQKFYNDIRLSMARKEWIDDDKVQTFSGKQKSHVGAKCEIWAEKNRYSDPFIKWPIVILFGKGVSNLYAYREYLQGVGVMSMSGAGFWKLALPNEEELKARGDEGSLNLVKENLPKIKAYIEANGGWSVIADNSVESDDSAIDHVDLGDEFDLDDLMNLNDGE